MPNRSCWDFFFSPNYNSHIKIIGQICIILEAIDTSKVPGIYHDHTQLQIHCYEAYNEEDVDRHKKNLDHICRMMYEYGPVMTRASKHGLQRVHERSTVEKIPNHGENPKSSLI